MAKGLVSSGVANLEGSRSTAVGPREVLGGTPLTCLMVFLASSLVLFLGMSRLPNLFDEGIVLTAAMRVASGQLPHRDFYSLYGPGQFYMLAGLFRLFGPSILVERLFDILAKALVVTTVYSIARAYCRGPVAAVTSLLAFLWLSGLNHWPGSSMFTVSLLNLIGSALILPVLSRTLPRWRLMTAGAISGMAALLRYDTGIALLVLDLCVVAISVFVLHRGGASIRLRHFSAMFWPCLVGFALVTLPPLVFYLSVAPAGPLVHDMILYPARYYHRGRNLPFPGIRLHMLENLGIYLSVATAALALFVATTDFWYARRRDQAAAMRAWQGFLLTFSLLAGGMFLKGLVRVSLFQISLAIVPSLLLLAVLFEHRYSFSRPLRFSIVALVWLSLLAVVSLTRHATQELTLRRDTVLSHLLARARATPLQEETEWCKVRNPLTVGLCFIPEEERRDTIKYIASHTSAAARLYVGLTRHDKIFANDNIIYFATQRLPATKWSELDPDLESRYDVQEQMVHEFEVTAPPYIVLDSEFNEIWEPNDSSRSSGVTLLDDYIRSKYHQVEELGELSIWQRKPSGP